VVGCHYFLSTRPAVTRAILVTVTVAVVVVVVVAAAVVVVIIIAVTCRSVHR